MGHSYVEEMGGGERMTEICKVPESNLLIYSLARILVIDGMSLVSS